ncbi:PREDICTED: uncharacterized protein LOC108569945 [Nicrophorus vespilloides]|uniref:Uncharacterized protein LOC108569945 n=1 Tax=Nicrophorus vespilloides TaxID=110193 RepID=A0ABM1NK69_NICVS|nr:PREDICTED: uncharacterized protein LOC108569945 [Nicrophorus vespilloides]XP_017787216.1 PREDICTED: uncharacterized protein LOC108569945 [Nicrophorus vespilloides]XP_017787217.1 PREDICTED: uncharacterized protein LOC108569945 [Nicrophorus vespilloides]XP_017787218.1 PREDICTED: uncharacterized protein LOC108569945 [Nicrophorus vespilloides]XP_017787219.1 PREDICTED: uncharacterized protein LOC108569945 [Nicrophorus vespilloides]XP_017787220.1 PREDICTED: uncharacterized protein LOC108569945 [N
MNFNDLSDNMNMLKFHVNALNAVDYVKSLSENEAIYLNKFDNIPYVYIKEELDKPKDFGALSLDDTKEDRPWVHMCNDTFLYSLANENFVLPLNKDNVIFKKSTYTEYVSIGCEKSVDNSSKNEDTLLLRKDQTLDDPMNETFVPSLDFNNHLFSPSTEDVRNKLMDNQVFDLPSNECKTEKNMKILNPIDYQYEIENQFEIEMRKKIETEAQIEIQRQIEFDEVSDYEEEIEFRRQLHEYLANNYSHSIVHKDNDDDGENENNLLAFIGFASITIVGLYLIFRN